MPAEFLKEKQYTTPTKLIFLPSVGHEARTAHKRPNEYSTAQHSTANAKRRGTKTELSSQQCNSSTPQVESSGNMPTKTSPVNRGAATYPTCVCQTHLRKRRTLQYSTVHTHLALTIPPRLPASSKSDDRAVVRRFSGAQAQEMPR